MNIQQLYQQVIISHNKSPKNFGKLDHYTHMAEGYNPLCGDHFTVYINIKDGIIDAISFEGEGCAISKASASLMTQGLKGKTLEEADTLFNAFHDMITGKIEVEANQLPLKKLTVFTGVRKYPSRIKCAALAWHTFKSATKGNKNLEVNE